MDAKEMPTVQATPVKTLEVISDERQEKATELIELIEKYCQTIELILNDKNFELEEKEKKALEIYQYYFSKHKKYIDKNKNNRTTLNTIEYYLSKDNTLLYSDNIYKCNEFITNIVDEDSGFNKYKNLLKFLDKIFTASMIAGIITLSLGIPLEISLPLLIGGFALSVIILSDFAKDSTTSGPSSEDQNVMKTVTNDKFLLWKSNIPANGNVNYPENELHLVL